MKKVYALVLNLVFLMAGCAFGQVPWIEWQKFYGGSGIEGGRSIHQTYDGGYIVISSAGSYDGDVSSSNGGGDYWIVKLDSYGNIQWENSYGGSNGDVPSAIEKTSDHGFIACGYTGSNDSDVLGNHGGNDYWVIKIDSTGNLQWQKCFGGTANDEAYDICQITDGSYIVVGHSYSIDGDVMNTNTDGCSWMIKLDGSGNLISQKVSAYTGSIPDSIEILQKVTALSNNCAAVGGGFGYRDGFHSYTYLYAGKLDSSMNVIWDIYSDFGYYGANVWCHGIEPTADGGYVLTTWFSGMVRDAVIKLDSAGNVQWNTYPSIYLTAWIDHAKAIQCADGGYAYVWYNSSSDALMLVKLGFNTTSVKENPFTSLNLNARLSLDNNLSLTFSSLQSTNLRLMLTDITGRTLYQTQVTTTTGINKKEIPVGDLAKGIYIVTLSGEEGNESVKVVKE